MSTFGTTPAAASAFDGYTTAYYNQLKTNLLTMPVDGIVSSISLATTSFYSSAIYDAYWCLWDSAGTLLVSGVQIEGSAYSGVGPPTSPIPYTTVPISDTYLGAGEQFYIGCTFPAGGGSWISNQSAPVTPSASQSSGGNPGNLGSSPASIGTQIDAFITYTQVYPPTATTTATTSVGLTTATLNGAVDDNGFSAAGGGSSDWYLNISTSPSMASPTTVGSGTFTGSSNETASATGLAEATTYYAQCVVTNATGTVSGAIVSFETGGLCNTPTPTAPSVGAATNPMTTSVPFTWTYNNGGASGSQTGYSLGVIVNGTTYYWTGATAAPFWSTTETWITSSTQGVTIPSGLAIWSYPSGSNPFTPQTVQWTVANADANGDGPFASPQNLILEGPPSAPTLVSPANASYSDMSGTPTVTWTYKATNAVGGQTAFAIRRKVSGGSYSYWNVGTSAWQSTMVWNTSTAQSYTFPSSSWTNGNTYNFSVATEDAGSYGSLGAATQGPFAIDFTVNAQVAPSVTVTEPSGTISAIDPTIAWSVSFPTGAEQTQYQVRTFTAAQYGGSGFNPATSAAYDDTGQVGGSATSYRMGTYLTPNTSYRSYVQVGETGGEMSAYEYASYTLAVDVPPTPTLTATASTDSVTGCPCIQLQVQANFNVLSLVDASFESGIGTYVGTNATLSQSSTYGLDGLYSLEMVDNTTTGGMSATSADTYAVSPSTAYTAMAYFTAGSTNREVNVAVNWYTSGSVFISTSTSSNVLESTASGTWVQALWHGSSPSNAAFASIVVSVVSSASTEVHYVDQVGLILGTTSTWSEGGLLSTAQVVITRSDGVYVRNASPANPLPLTSLTQSATVNDYEVAQNSPYTYTAVLQSTPASQLVQSVASSPSGASVSATSWWMIDVLSDTATSAPTSTPQVVQQNNLSQTEQSAAHYPTGSTSTTNYPTVVSSGYNGIDGTMTVWCSTHAGYAQLVALLTVGRTIFISSPYGDALFGRLGLPPGGMGGGGSGNTARSSALAPSSSSQPVRTLHLTFIGQPRPAV